MTQSGARGVDENRIGLDCDRFGSGAGLEHKIDAKFFVHLQEQSGSNGMFESGEGDTDLRGADR